MHIVSYSRQAQKISLQEYIHKYSKRLLKRLHSVSTTVDFDNTDTFKHRFTNKTTKCSANLEELLLSKLAFTKTPFNVDLYSPICENEICLFVKVIIP